MNTKFLLYIFKRLGMAVLTMFLVIAITFFVMHAIPASPFNAEKALSDETIAALEAKYGFDKPVPVQFLNYLANILRGDFGLSTKWVGSTVSELIMGGFSYSMKLGLSAAGMAIVVGVILGALAALKRGKLLDKIIQVVTTALVSMPSFVIATLLLIIFALRLGWAPTMATQPGGMVLPALSLSLYPMAYITRLERSAMLDVLGQDYIRTARAKGLKKGTVNIKHALRNAMLPISTVIGLQFGSLLGGALLTETVFAWPGIGKFAVDCVLKSDFPVVQGIVLLVAVIFVIMNLVVDIVYAYLDPRIKYGAKEEG